MSGNRLVAVALGEVEDLSGIEPGDILGDVADMLSRFVAFPSDHARDAVALWVVHCHAIDAFESTPRLALLSPEKGSGKTRTLELLGLLVPRPIHAVNMSAAALYRVVADQQPTLLLDECDTYLGNTIAKQHEELRGLVNAGHRRGAMVYRGEVAGKAVKVAEFPAFAACALAGIGDLPDTILDRSVIVAMKRRAPNEHVDAFRERLVRPEADSLRLRVAAWAQKHTETLRDAWPVMPIGIVDRAADVWEPLLAVADLAGADWPTRARSSAVAMNKARAERDPSLGVLLLTDCRSVFDTKTVDRLTSEDLLEALTELDESPWKDLRGKPLDNRGLSKRLRKYDVRPGSHRFGDATRRGYLREDFHDAWLRYLAPVTDVADVADVADEQSERGAGDLLQVSRDDLPPYLHKHIGNGSLSSTKGPQQAQQALTLEESEEIERLASLARSEA